VSPTDIARLVSGLPTSDDPNVLIGFETADDAGVYRLDDERALVQTLDFFPPVLDDPYDYGRVVAANSLSDVYAMGARPLCALAIAIVPGGKEWLEVLGTVMKGLAEGAHEDGVALLGGHTMYGPEPVFGLSVTGLVDPALVTSNAGARPGDALVLTKPIGSGILTTAHMKQALSRERLEFLTRVMRTSNRRAAEVAAAHDARSVTDVTGFGLLGHLNWMMTESGTTGVVRAGDVPLMPGTLEHFEQGHLPGGSRRNMAHVEGTLVCDETVGEAMRLILADAQTSGGLIIAIDPAKVGAVLADLPDAALVGEVAPREEGVTIRVVP
jgi:selenide,water dikinase